MTRRCSPQVDNQLLGTTQPVMLCVTPASGDAGASDSGPALQLNAVKVPSSLMFTELYKVSERRSGATGRRTRLSLSCVCSISW